VLVGAVCEMLAPQPGDVVLDVTVGLGGHARMLAGAVGPDGMLIGMDVDGRNLEAARRTLTHLPCRVVLERENFADLDAFLERIGVSRVNVILADLGVSSTQIDDPRRGFSFRNDGPLDMRLDDRSQRTAADLVNSLREDELSDLFFFNSQERFSRRIAKRICQARKDRRITTTARLSEVVCDALGVDPDSRSSKIHPATRVFQALRIAVNDELGALKSLLEKAPDRLEHGGRIGVIAFHSIEDGVVKRDFRSRKTHGVYEVLTKRPLIASPEERDANPRSRSAKFRAARRCGESATRRTDPASQASDRNTSQP